MGRIASILSLLSALFLYSPLLSAQTAALVEGVVVDSKTGVPIAGVSVYFGSDDGPHFETQTDPSGQFQIAGLPNGDYGCHFEKSGYITQYSGAGNSILKSIHVAGAQEPIHLTVSLSAYAKLRGRVFDPEGNPVAHAKVTLAPLEETTDDHGQFSFSQIVPGSYALKANATVVQPPRIREGAEKEAETTQAESPAEERTALLPTWYPSTTQADLAEPVIVRSGDDLSGVDIRLQASPVYRVRGKVFNLDGTLVRGASITSFVQGDLATVVSSTVGGKSAPSDSLGYFTLSHSQLPAPADEPGDIVRNGSFELASVPRGLRQFRVTPMIAADPEQLKQRIEELKQRAEEVQQARKQGLTLPPILHLDTPPVLPVSAVVSAVIDHDIDDLEIRFQPPAVVEVATELWNTPADKTPPAVRTASVMLNSPGRVSKSGTQIGNIVRFAIEPGEVLVDAPPGLAGGYYLSSVNLGVQDITWKSFTIQAGAPPITVNYKPNGGTVTGSVESSDAGSVMLIPQAALDSVDVHYGRIAPLRHGGAFEIGSLAPGSYYAFAVDRMQPERLSNPTAARRIAAAATLVQVNEGAAVSIKPPLIRLDD